MAKLRKEGFGSNHLYLEKTDSTNEVIKRLLRDGATIETSGACDNLIEGDITEGTVVSAGFQTAGKGRRGRSWDGESGRSLMFSLLLTPDAEAAKVSAVTLVVAMGVCRTIRDYCNLDTIIKWPNDIVIRGRKLCGILTELEAVDGKQNIIVGVGINVRQEEFPDDIKDIATSIYRESGVSYGFDALLAEILENIEKYYKQFTETMDMSKLVDEYNELMAGRDTVITVMDPKEPFKGKALGIDSSGELLVEDMSGEVHRIYAGEVSIGGIYGN